MRGQKKVAADFNLLTAAVNLARLTRLGVIHDQGVWATNTI
ncbi:MAG: transposase [Actinobacteria bacterium]|nr:transposase [Actinomycetota bacterium]MCL5447166.1 transposase [Actinomycetota bacterium]